MSQMKKLQYYNNIVLFGFSTDYLNVGTLLYMIIICIIIFPLNKLKIFEEGFSNKVLAKV